VSGDIADPPDLTPEQEAEFQALTGGLAEMGDAPFTITDEGWLHAPTIGFLFDIDQLLAVTADLNGYAVLLSTKGTAVSVPIRPEAISLAIVEHTNGDGGPLPDPRQYL